MQKKALLALMLALTLVLTGCTLVQKDPEVDKAQAIITLGDQVITKGEITDTVNSQMEYMSYLYSLYGYSYDATDPEHIAEAREAVIADYDVCSWVWQFSYMEGKLSHWERSS